MTSPTARPSNTSFPGSALPRGTHELESVYDIPVTVSAVLGKATMQISQLWRLGRGAVVKLDRRLGEASRATRRGRPSFRAFGRR